MFVNGCWNIPTIKNINNNNLSEVKIFRVVTPCNVILPQHYMASQP